MVYSGMGPDSRVLVTKARKIAQRYMLTYGEPIPTNQLVREIASVMQEFTQSGGVRPFGVSLIVIGSDDKGPTMYQVFRKAYMCTYMLVRMYVVGEFFSNVHSYTRMCAHIYIYVYIYIYIHTHTHTERERERERINACMYINICVRFTQS
jgi:hypothetical protein